MYGARPLKRYLQKNVETLAARLILAGNVGREDTILIDAKDGKLKADVKRVNSLEETGSISKICKKARRKESA